MRKNTPPYRFRYLIAHQSHFNRKTINFNMIFQKITLMTALMKLPLIVVLLGPSDDTNDSE